MIVCTRDRPADLSRCLETLAALEYPDWELIVAEQGDARQGPPADLPHYPALRWLSLPTKGRSLALNEALTYATGELIALTDDDCEPAPDWLQRGAEQVARVPGAGIVCGAVLAKPHDPSLEHVPTCEIPREVILRRPSDILRHGRGIGANMMMHRQAFERVGGFATWTGPGTVFRSGDDFEFQYRVLRAGLPVVLDPRSRILHWGGRTLAHGQVRRLARNHSYGMGAIYGAYLRRGDPVAARLMAQEIRSLGLRPHRLRYLLWGASQTLLRPPPSPPRVRLGSAS